MLPGGHKKVINTRSVTVVEEIIQELCEELNVRSSAEQQEFCLAYVVEKGLSCSLKVTFSENTIMMLDNSDYILDVCTEQEMKEKSIIFLLKRTVWLHPLRFDNQLYIDVMFHQCIVDYKEGHLVVFQRNRNISAAILDDIASLSAYLYLAEVNDRKPLTS